MLDSIYHRAYMSVHTLLNLLNQLRKRDKMQGLTSILSLFWNMFKKFNNTGAQMFDSYYHRTLKLLKHHTFGVKMSSLCNTIIDIIT